MTEFDALRIIEFCHTHKVMCKDCHYLDNCPQRHEKIKSIAFKALHHAILLLEKAEKYRWHDLRKDPNDLPEEDAEIAVTWVNHDPVSYYAHIKDKPFPGFAVYHKKHFWWWSSDCLEDLREFDFSPMNEMSDEIEVIAWREIEPLEEE